MIASTKHVVKVVNAQPVSECNPITGMQVVNKPIDVVVADNAKLGKNPVVADKDNVVKKTVVVDKDDVVKKHVVVDKDDVVKKPVVADKDDVVKKPVVADKAPTTVVVSVTVPVVKKSVKASSVVADKPSSVVADKVDVVKDNINVVTDKVVKENVLFVVAYKASNINVVAGVKDKPQVSRVSPKKSKVIGSDSPRKKWVTRDMIASTKHAVKVVNAQPVSEFNLNPVVADKDNVVKKTVVVDKDDVVKKLVVADKDDVVKKPVVADKAPTTVVVSVKVPVVKKSVKASSVVADKPSSVVADKVDVVKDNINVVSDKVVKENVLSVVAYKASNIIVVAVADKASDALKNKPARKGKKPVVGKDKENFHDCGIFTMLHMETFDGGPASNLDCGLLVESQLQRDMLRRLRFKFSTKILLHEINVHAGKMLELAKEFDKTDPVEKMAIIVDAFKKREERDYVSR
ncbi:hypothetical protein Tco_1571594 [Tanacetum coccineum]